MRRLEFLLVALIYGTGTAAGYAVQDYRLEPGWDGRLYVQMTEAFIHGTDNPVEAPAGYRVLVPWLVARLFPATIIDGYWALNQFAAALGVFALAAWLRVAGIAPLTLRLLLVGLFVAIWPGPTRFSHFYPSYVDPLFLAALWAGLGLIELLRRQFRLTTLGLLAGLCAVGVFVRETILLVPLSFLLVNNPIGGGHQPPRRVPVWALVVPCIAAGFGSIVLHFVVAVPPPSSSSGVSHVLSLAIRQPPTVVLLGLFVTFGPVLALVAYDWRRAAVWLRGHQHVVALTAPILVLAYLGLPDTERFLVWAAPAIYGLVGHALWRYRRELSYWPFAASLVVMQAVSARVFWGVPDPYFKGVAFEELSGLGAQAYGVLDRLVVINAFYNNLWSSTGSVPFMWLRLAVYLVVSLVLVASLHRRGRRLMSGSPPV
ncbi:MAG: hypothetical protein ACT4QD_20590 [Acidobacteriota bacterium]